MNTHRLHKRRSKPPVKRLGWTSSSLWYHHDITFPCSAFLWMWKLVFGNGRESNSILFNFRFLSFFSELLVVSSLVRFAFDSIDFLIDYFFWLHIYVKLHSCGTNKLNETSAEIFLRPWTCFSPLFSDMHVTCLNAGLKTLFRLCRSFPF